MFIDDGTELQSGLFDDAIDEGYADGEISLPLVGMVIGVFYPDDEENLSKQYIEYEVVLPDGATVSNVISTCNSGGFVNGLDRVLTPATKKTNGGTITDEEDFANLNGTYVLLQCPYADPNQMTITAVLPHPKSTLSAKKADGNRVLFSHQDTEISLDNDGTLDIKRVKTRNSATSVVTAYEDTELKISNTNIITVKTTDCVLTIENGKLTATSPAVDLVSDKVTVKSSASSLSAQALCNKAFYSQMSSLTSQVLTLTETLIMTLGGAFPPLVTSLGAVYVKLGQIQTALLDTSSVLTENLDSE